ncbi:GNAT family N-acetyltransferase [Occultella glacieicola]|nr:GNAT family N-acetyltransferase [Occultella glacieicola]
MRRAELPAAAEVYLDARHAAGAAFPPSVHSDREVRAWVRSWDLSEDLVLGCFGRDGRLQGFAWVSADHLEGLYVDPRVQGSGVGSALLAKVKQVCPEGFDLWAFVTNTAALRFYAAHGLVEVQRTDGAGNEERAPDLRMAWRLERPSG